MERSLKRKRTSNSPDAPDVSFDQRASGSKLCAQCENYKQEADRYYKRYQELEKSNNQLVDRNRQLEHETAKLYQQQQLDNQKKGTKHPESAKAGETEEELRRHVRRLDKQLIMERKAKNDALKAKNDALTRLAENAGRKIFDNNPDITDLSDPNRPMKLAEQMSELYDNEWTNALENLLDKKLTEEQGIKKLLDTLTDIYVFCEEAANKQFSGVRKHVVVPEGALQFSSNTEMGLSAPPEDFIKIMKVYRKKNWICAVPLLQKAFKEKRRHDRLISSCIDYVDKCVKLCWLMKIQDPPVHMEWNFSNGVPFDTSVFRTYTKMGNVIDFMVWPILFLHKNGPILGKGIAQGMKPEKRQNPRQGTVI